MTEYKISPIFYMGNKKKLIKRGLIKLFPKNINKFFDVFGGSGVVSLNVKANKIYLNDKDENLFRLYKMFQHYSCVDIIGRIEDNIKKYGLALENTRRGTFTDVNKLNTYKKAYLSLREEFNKTNNVLDFYTLMFYSFSQQFRFNSKGNFNMPVGSDYFSNKHKTLISNTIDDIKKFNVGKHDFRFFLTYIEYIKKEDFVYLDPPYFNTTATYNEKGGWSEEDELDLLHMCEQLNKRGIKFGLSNVFECKGKINQHLIKWCERNNFNVYTFDKFSYMACGKGNSNAKEVFICNY